MTIESFTNPEFAIELLQDGDSFDVVASGLAKALGHRDAGNMLAAVPEDEKGHCLVSTPGGDQRVWVVHEAGFYRVIGQRQAGRVKIPAQRTRVERFQKWVYGEVLPSLRRDGRYEVPGREPAVSLSSGLDLANLDHVGLIVKAAGAALARVEALSAANAELAETVERQAPLVEAWEVFANARGLIHPAVFAQQSGIVRANGKPLGQNSMIDALRALRILKDAKGTDRHNTPFQQHAHRIKAVAERKGAQMVTVPYIWPRHAHYLRGRILAHLYPVDGGAQVLQLPSAEDGRGRSSW